MSKLYFHSDAEFAVFLWRRFSTEIDQTAFVLTSQVPNLEELEQTISTGTKWRICENELSGLFASLCDSKVEKLKDLAQKVTVELATEVENGWLTESYGFQFEVKPKEASRTCALRNDLIVLIGCVLSLCISQDDVGSVARLFAVIRPPILNALKKLCTTSNLSINQTLFSYIMKAEIEGDGGPDAILNQYYGDLRTFYHSHEELHNFLMAKGQGIIKDKNALHMVIQSAMKFLKTKERFSHYVNIQMATNEVEEMKNVLVDNYHIIENIAPITEQRFGEMICSRERICRALADHICCLELPVEGFSSTVFKTPQRKKFMSQAVTPKVVTQESVADAIEESKTPVRLATFTNNDTPTPIRPAPTLLVVNEEHLESLEEIQELEDEDNVCNKENVEACIEHSKPIIHTKSTPQRKRKSLPAQKPPIKRNSLGAKGKEAKKVEVSQKSITSFFNRRST